MNKYLAESDDFYVNVNLNTEMELPTSRDTVLHFFEQMKKRFPDLRNFYTKEEGDLVLEGDKEQESYRVVAIEPRRLCSGHVNPETLEAAYAQHELVLELAPHLLTISVLDCEALDVMFGFDFDYEGPHDELVAEALGVGPAFEGLSDLAGSKVLNFEPSITLALDESCRLQARLSVGKRTRPHIPRVVPEPAGHRRGDCPELRGASRGSSTRSGDLVAVLKIQSRERPTHASAAKVDHPRRSP
jgi:hypothetical protein